MHRDTGEPCDENPESRAAVREAPKVVGQKRSDQEQDLGKEQHVEGIYGGAPIERVRGERVPYYGPDRLRVSRCLVSWRASQH